MVEDGIRIREKGQLENQRPKSIKFYFKKIKGEKCIRDDSDEKCIRMRMSWRIQ